VVEPRGGEVHNIEFNLDALRALGIEPANRMPVVVADAAADAFARTFIDGLGASGTGAAPDAAPLVALNPGGGWISKKWRPAQFAEFGRALRRDYGATLLVLWGPGERETALEIQTAIGDGAHLPPPTDLKQLGAILRRCDVLVTNDSGPMHLATAMNVPVVAIFGPTNPDLQGPCGKDAIVVRHRGLPCLGCNYTVCPIGNPCMEELAPDDVLASFRMLYETIDRSKQSQHAPTKK
jgi:heptosyltransferase-2